MLYTSGTTGRPKGVRLSHAALAATVSSLEEAWRWRGDDRLLHVLPLHHTHGADRGAAGRAVGRRRGPLPAVRRRRRVGRAGRRQRVHGGAHDLRQADAGVRRRAARAARALGGGGGRVAARHQRLGGAAGPMLHAAFARATGQPAGTLRHDRDRHGAVQSLRRPARAGRGGVRAARRHRRHHRRIRAHAAAEEPGELRVRTTQMFSGYHGDPAATAARFDAAGRFCTGDTGVRDTAGVVRLLGRTSIDIIKSGGYKLSALEIEAVLPDHPAVAEVAVLGVADATFGELVTAWVVPRGRASRRWRSCKLSRASGWRPTSCRARCTSSPSCLAMRWARCRSSGCARFPDHRIRIQPAQHRAEHDVRDHDRDRRPRCP